MKRPHDLIIDLLAAEGYDPEEIADDIYITVHFDDGSAFDVLDPDPDELAGKVLTVEVHNRLYTVAADDKGENFTLL